MNFISFENRRNSVHQQFTQDIAETAHEQFTLDSLCDQFVFISVDVDVRPFLACMTSAPGAALQRTNQSTPQTALSSCSWRLAPPTKVLI